MTVTVNETNNIIEITAVPTPTIVIDSGGSQGPEGGQGPAGNNGVGVAVGGTNGQVLIKNSAADYDTSWVSDLSGITIGQVTPALGNFTNIRYTGDIDFSSDARLKRDIQPLEDLTKELMALTPVSFRRQAKESRFQYGFLAQDVKNTFPSMVGIDNNGCLTLHGMDMLAILVKVVQEQNHRIRILEGNKHG